MKDARVGLFVFLSLAVTVSILLARELETRRARESGGTGAAGAGAAGAGAVTRDPPVPDVVDPQQGIPEADPWDPPVEPGIPGETAPVEGAQVPFENDPEDATPADLDPLQRPPGGVEGSQDPVEPAPGSLVQIAPLPPTPPPSPATPDTYTVQRGDVLSVIAQKIYGKSALWRLIYEANRDTLDSPEDLRVDQVLRIPPRPAGAAPPAPIPGAPGEGRIHVVREGEYLSTIAQHYYGNVRPSTLQMLYEANKDRMRSPDDLSAGTRLLIPELPR